MTKGANSVPPATSVRHATEQDVDAILQLEKASPQAPHWSREVYEQIVTAGKRSQPATNGRARCLLVAVAEGGASESRDIGRILGFAVGALVLEEGRVAGLKAELESIAISDSMRRQGTGEALCHAVLEWVSARGADTIALEVRAGNAAALGLYRKLGFERAGWRPRYYSDPEEDALLMSMRLEQ